MPLSVPEMPVEASSTDLSATYDLDGLLQLKRVYETLQTNTTVAAENALAIEARNGEVNALIECTRNMNLWIEFHADDLEDEKQAHRADVWWLRGVIALVLAAGIL